MRTTQGRARDKTASTNGVQFHPQFIPVETPASVHKSTVNFFPKISLNSYFSTLSTPLTITTVFISILL